MFQSWQISLDTETTEPHILASFPWSTVTVDYFLIERMANTFEAQSLRKWSFMQIYMPLMGYDHMVALGNQDDVFVRRGLQI